jgi:hypothetical protein
VRIHCVSYYDEPDQHELVHVDYQCSTSCMHETLAAIDTSPPDTAGSANLPDGGSVSWGGLPGGEETNDDVRCSTCGVLLWKGLSPT